ncbi:tRNA-splicing endonuclease subunit Sen34 [Megalops cyprinoides]|uniref:tRNA-splicing endonuclease subunit Sen34 n=1 Tax=Megalops cyprinoides TaxID=118141 RepID=UPI0018656664|nr:tRNA-splicing endonuclease subunit Sen34 [Megalops cyprinoides]
MEGQEVTGSEGMMKIGKNLAQAETGVNEDNREEGAVSGSAQRCRKIQVRFCGSTPLLWRTAEVRAARESGVVGTLVGSLPRQPRQNNRLGRPLELLQEEARLLTETGQAVLCPAVDPESAEATSSHKVERHLEMLERSYEEQKALALQDRKSVLMRVLTQKQEDADSGECSEQAVRDRLEALEKGFSLPRSAMAVQLHTARAGLGHDPEERHFLMAEWLQPRDERSEIRFRVFRDLRRQGYYLTSAGKFGGDYLVYPGDPLRFHAHFIALCVSMETMTPLCDLLALSRLGANVKKTILLCSPSDGDGGEEEDEVVYTSLQWSGMV